MIIKIIKNKVYLKKIQRNNLNNIVHDINFLTYKIDNLKKIFSQNALIICKTQVAKYYT